MGKVNLEYDPSKKPDPNANIKEELAGRLKLEIGFLRNQLDVKDKELEEKNKIIGRLNKQIVERDKFIEENRKDFELKEKDLLKKYDNLKSLIEPEVITEKSTRLDKVLNYLGIKVSYI